MKQKKGMGLLAKQKAAGWGFLAPASLLIFIMSFYPMVQAFITSLKPGAEVGEVVVPMELIVRESSLRN